MPSILSFFKKLVSFFFISIYIITDIHIIYHSFKYIIEIKHSRVAMLATVGFVATEFVRLPGDVHSVSSIEAHNAGVAAGSMYQILTLIAALEFIGIVALKQTFDGSRMPGDFGFDPLGFYNGKSSDQKAKLQAQELENGRTAMLAFAGIVTQAVVTGKGFPYF